MIPMHTPNRRPAFSLLEILLVISIVAVLLGLLLCAVQRVRAAAARAACADRLRQFGLAAHSYHTDHHAFPPGVAHKESPPLYGPELFPYPLLAWQGRLLPYLEQDALWREVVKTYADDPHLASTGIGPGEVILDIFLCPTQPKRVPTDQFRPHPLGPSSYLGIAGINDVTRDGVLFFDSSIRFTDITDGTSNTLFAGERPICATNDAGRWFGGWVYAQSANSYLGVEETFIPASSGCLDIPVLYGPDRLDAPCAPYHFWSRHPGGSNFLVADGSVQFLRYTSAPILAALATRSGGDVAFTD